MSLLTKWISFCCDIVKLGFLRVSLSLKLRNFVLISTLVQVILPLFFFVFFLGER